MLCFKMHLFANKLEANRFHLKTVKEFYSLQILWTGNASNECIYLKNKNTVYLLKCPLVLKGPLCLF